MCVDSYYANQGGIDYNVVFVAFTQPLNITLTVLFWGELRAFICTYVDTDLLIHVRTMIHPYI